MTEGYYSSGTIEIVLDRYDTERMYEGHDIHLQRGEFEFNISEYSNDAPEFSEILVYPEKLLPESNGEDNEIYDDIRGALWEMLSAWAEFEKLAAGAGGDMERWFETLEERYDIGKANQTYKYYDTVRSNYRNNYQ